MTNPPQPRRMFQWGAAYLGGAWLVVQVLDAVADPWGVPDAVLRTITVLLAVGFVAAMVVAWYHGEKGRQRVSGPELLLLGGLALCAGLLVRMTVGGSGQAASSASGVSAPTTAPAENTIAVLPFLDLSPDGDQQHFGDGIADEIIGVLSRDGRLRVAGRSSSFSLRDRSATEVGEALTVANVLEGTVRTEGDRIRIQVSLVSTEDGFERWSRRYDRSASSILRIQAEIATAVAAEVTASPVEAPEEPQLLSPEASDLYFQARAHWTRRARPDLLRALELFERVTDLEPGFARGLSGLADTYAVLGFYNYLPSGEAFPAARRHANEALAIDPGLADAWATIAYADMYYERDWAGAEEGFKRSLELNPNYAVAHQWYGNLLTIVGRHDEAVEEFRTAVSLEPLSLITQAALPWGLYYAREYEEALARFRQVLDLDPRYELAHYWMGWTLEQIGDMEGAIAALEEAVALSDSSEISLAALAGAYGRAGRETDARALVARLEDPLRTDNPPSYELGKAHLAVGEVDEAFDWFERAYRERALQLAFIGVDPEVDRFRGDQRLASLLARLDLPPAPALGGR